MRMLPTVNGIPQFKFRVQFCEAEHPGLNNHAANVDSIIQKFILSTNAKAIISKQ
jgi:adenosine/AMP kinase